MAAITPISMSSVQSVANTSSGQKIFGNSFRETFARIDNNYVRMEQQVSAAAKNDRLSPSQLLAIQSGVLRSSLELDITSKVIEKVSSGIKQTMSNQV